MQRVYDELYADIEKIQQIPIVPTILEVVCRTTGMGFAAIARVTEDRWIACSVRDEIKFGLEPGGELQIETTICNEIRDSHTAVIIDHVDLDEKYNRHHTPQMYGFQSYISVPIFLKNGEFFGTLCAIDPNPAKLNDVKIIGMFNLFADLISFHLQSLDLMRQSNQAVQELSKQLNYSIEENRQYQFISDHNLQEPLRKIRFLSSALINTVGSGDGGKTKELALKINSNAQRFSMMIKDISQFSRLTSENLVLETVNLNHVVADVCTQLSVQIEAKKARIEWERLPLVDAVQLHMEQLFFHLTSNAIKFCKSDVSPVIRVSARSLTLKEENPALQYSTSKYVELRSEDNGRGIEKSQFDKIFDTFSTLNYEPSLDGFGVGLAFCRKVVHIYGGAITAQSEPGKGTTFIIILPEATAKN